MNRHQFLQSLDWTARVREADELLLGRRVSSSLALENRSRRPIVGRKVEVK